MACVSGSPNRTLNSSSRGPSAVSIRPANSAPRNGVPRRASSAQHRPVDVSHDGRHGRVRRGRRRRDGAHAAGVGPGSPSRRRLWSRAAGSASAVVASQMAMTLASCPSRLARRPRAGRPSPKAPSTSAPRMAASARSASVAQTSTPLPAASPSALTTTGPPSLSARRTAATASVNAPRRPSGRRPRRRDLAAERLAGLEPRRRGARARTRRCRRHGVVGQPGDQRRLRPDDDQVGLGSPAADAMTASESAGHDVGREQRRRRPCPGCPAPRRRLDARLRGQPPGERVLARARADDQHSARPRRHGHRRVVPRARGDRPRSPAGPRAIVCVRSGPTLTMRDRHARRAPRARRRRRAPRRAASSMRRDARRGPRPSRGSVS